MTTHEVTEAIGKAMGFGPEATVGLKSRVRSNLLYLAKVRGTVVKDGELEKANVDARHLTLVGLEGRLFPRLRIAK